MNTTPKDKSPTEMMLSPEEWDTVRSECGQARATYLPRFSWQPIDHVSSLTWITYQEGTAGRHFATLGDAVEFLRSKGFSFDLS
jgi:hypothetical protein